MRTGVEIYAHRLAVSPVHRRVGVGRALMSYVEGQAAAADCAYVRAGARLALPGNLAFFTRLGYANIIEESHPGYAAPTFAHMVKERGSKMLRVVKSRLTTRNGRRASQQRRQPCRRRWATP
jgi:ribosomal protein S18 acetylase RimI-like enzyme